MGKRVIVIGAGLAGLAAAQLLQRRGHQVLVLERESRVGGRVFSQDFHGRRIECGAQFPSTGYRHLPALLAEAGLSARPCSPWAAFEREGRWQRVHQNRPLTLWSGGLLRASEFARMAWGMPGALRSAKRLRSASYADYAAFDDEDALDWSTRTLGAGAATRLFAPSVHGLYFHPLAGSSKALMLALLGFRDAQTLAIPQGWDALPRAMAASLRLHTGTPVEAVQILRAGVRVQVNGEALHADAALIATPAPIALGLLHDPTPEELALLATGCAAAVHIALGFAPGWQLPAEWAGVHGFLLGEREPVAAMVGEQARLPCAAPEVLTLMLGDVAARRLMARSDAEILQQVLAWLQAHWPALPAAVVAHRVQRWPMAEPLSPPGRARAVLRYRRSVSAARPLRLCGDGTGLPWTDGAVESGLWAAAQLAQTLQ
jgi:oxygen-dependent protoporphyrinogen oxidase